MALIRVGANGHWAIKYMIPLTSGEQWLPMTTIGDQRIRSCMFKNI